MLSALQAQINSFSSSIRGNPEESFHMSFGIPHKWIKQLINAINKNPPIVTFCNIYRSDLTSPYFSSRIRTNISRCIFCILALASFLFITASSEHFKAPYGLDCGSVLAHAFCRSEACCTFGFYPWIIFTGDMLRSHCDSETRELFLDQSSKNNEVQSNLNETNEKRCPPDVPPTRLNAWRFD